MRFANGQKGGVLTAYCIEKECIVKVPAFLGMMMLIMFTSPLFGIFRLASGPLFLVLTYFIMAVYDSSFKIDLASGIMIGIEGLVFITGVVINRQ